MINEDKSIYIAGTMFLALSTALFIAGVFIPKALGIALLTALVTYVFRPMLLQNKRLNAIGK